MVGIIRDRTAGQVHKCLEAVKGACSSDYRAGAYQSFRRLRLGPPRTVFGRMTA
jgi:hypothetical protein